VSRLTSHASSNLAFSALYVGLWGFLLWFMPNPLLSSSSSSLSSTFTYSLLAVFATLFTLFYLPGYSSETLLAFLLLSPFVAAGILILLSSASSTIQYNVGLILSIPPLVLTLLLFSSLSVGTPLGTPGLDAIFTFSLVPSLGLPFRFGVDGLSLPFLLLTTAFQPLCLLSLSSGTPRILSALIALFLLEGGVLATFAALDLLPFFLFFERTLIPIYFLVLIWGSRERRVRASYRISLYTLFGSIFRFLNLLYLRAKVGTTDFLALLDLTLSVADQRFLWITFFLAFAAKVPLFPLHIWLPEAHVEAPTVGSVLLAVLLLKLGTYGLVRFSLPLFPEGTAYFAPVVSVFAIRGVLYTCLTARRQIDLKKIIAYSSVGHRNVVLLGLRAGTSEGLQGGLFQRISHGIVSGALFFAVGVVYERYAVRSLKYFGGLAHLRPLFTRVFLLFSLANIAFPLTTSFVGEFLIFAGLARQNLLATILASTSRVLGAVYTLWTANRLLFGNLRTLSLTSATDLNAKESLLFALLSVTLLVRGVFPGPLLDLLLPDTRLLLEQARLGRLAILYFLFDFLCNLQPPSWPLPLPLIPLLFVVEIYVLYVELSAPLS
jgi:NADH-quinone oxidoreductase subunit M